MRYDIYIYIYVIRRLKVKSHLAFASILLLLLSVGLPVANAPDVLQPCGLLYYP